MKLPNRYGTVTKLSGNRRRPWVIREGASGHQKAIGYAATKEEALMILAQYNNNPWDIESDKITLQELFDLWIEKKSPKLGEANQRCLKSAYKHCSKLGRIPYKQIKAYQMQDCIDNCGYGYATQSVIKNLWYHLDKFALELDISSFQYSNLLTSESIPPTNRQPFTKEEITKLWEHQNEPWVDTVLIFIYSGWRISELLALRKEDIDLVVGTMKGGTKTKAGKGRIVPIHHKIRGFVENRLTNGNSCLISQNGKPVSINAYREIWSKIMDRLQMKHTPHECRHTFETLLDAAGGNRRCIDLLMGHTSKDTGNRVYNTRQ